MERNPFLFFLGEDAMARRRRGMALILVMTVILVLSIIATPFVLSMILQEKGAVAARCESQAWYAAEGGRNFAQWALMNGVECMERRYPSGPFRSYYYDTEEEIRLNLASSALPSSTRNPRGAIWGLSVQDEQGKVNLRTAPERVLRSLEDYLRNVAVNPRDFVTIYSGRDARWVFPQRIRSLGEKPLPDDPNTTYYGAAIDNATHYSPKMKLRVSKQGLDAMIVEVASNGLLEVPSRGHTVMTNPQVPGQYADGVLEVESRHPLNINTARPETLMAVLEGLSIRGVPASLVDRPAAARVAAALAGGRVERLERFLEILIGLDLAPEQKVAVALNAVDPGSVSLDGSGSVPFCFKNYDVYTFESHASQNNPAGAQVAGRGFREVVTVSPPVELVRYVESQYDFDSMYCFGQALSLIPGVHSFIGFPYGNRLMTFPNLTVAGGGIPSDTALKPQQTGGPTGNEASFMPRPASDFRGEFPREYRNLLQAVEHFDDTHEGKRMGGQPRTYPWGSVFGPTPLNANQPTAPAAQWPSVCQGGFEMWVRFDSISNPMTIFDIREQDWLNRLSLRVENGYLILTACDATMGVASNPIDNGAAEIRQPFTPLQDTWYHIGAYWKGNHYTGLALLVDGFAHPDQTFLHVNPETAPPPQGTGVITKLGAALSPTSKSIVLADNSWLLPNLPTALRIGDEIVIYDNFTKQISRGARGTNPTLGSNNYQPDTGKDHPLNATVSIFGYTSKLRMAVIRLDQGQNSTQPPIEIKFDRLTRGGGRILYNFGENPRAIVAGDKQDQQTQLRYIDDSQTEIGVTTNDPSGADITDYPDQGYIRIENEVIFYTGRSTGGVNGQGNAKFTGCTRGAKPGAPAARHDTGQRVELWCVPVDSYANYLDGTIIQAEDEWFGPVWKDKDRINYWIPFDPNTNTVLPLIRGGAVFGSRRMAHVTGEPVIPTFVARESDPGVGMENLGRDDIVTITDAENNREQARVRRASPPAWGGTLTIALAGGGGNAQLAAFWDNVQREYVPDDLHTRVLKFPSGELMAWSWLEKGNPSFTVGPIDGIVDEIKFFGSQRENVEFAAAVGETDRQAVLRGANGPQKGGLIKAGDEYIGYGSRVQNQLSILARNWLCSTKENRKKVHDLGDRVLDLSTYLPVTALSTDVTPTDFQVAIAQRLAGDDRQYRRGYVLIDEEVILFEKGGGNGRPLWMPVRWDGTTGLFRGMFGTQPQQHAADKSLVYGMPWRFWDTYKAQEFDNNMVYYQWSTEMDLARWDALTWTQDMPAQETNIAVHAIVRIDGKGELFNPAGQNERQIVLEFINAGAANPIRKIGYQNDPGLFDVRFLVEYKKDSFLPNEPWKAHSWKRAPRVKEIRVSYDRPSKTHFHEER